MSKAETSCLPPCGFLIIDKPAGLTSHDCVAKARRLLGMRRIGHGGTLDPEVTGVLPLAVGPATRLLPYLDGTKAYNGAIQLGVRTSTDDLSGEVLEEAPWPVLSYAELEQQLAAFQGVVQQRPPVVSAVHVDGERAYARARRGEHLELPERTVSIEELHLLNWDQTTGVMQLQLRCSAGTYVRSLARDLGARLGCGGALKSLRRTLALGFDLKQSCSLDSVNSNTVLVEPLEALVHLPAQSLNAEQWLGWTRGQRLELNPPIKAGQPLVITRPDGRFAGMALSREDGLLQPKLVLDAAG